MTTTHPTLGEDRLPRNPLLSEVLALVSKQKTKAKKIQILKENESLHLKSVLIWNFDESVKSMLPDGDVHSIRMRRLLEPNILTLHMSGKYCIILLKVAMTLFDVLKENNFSCNF